MTGPSGPPFGQRTRGTPASGTPPRYPAAPKSVLGVGRGASLHPMKLEGIHHVTAITGDAPGNVDFYVRVLGLRLVKKGVHQSEPTLYRPFCADEYRQRCCCPTLLQYPGPP